MDFLLGPIMTCVAQACCWYSIFSWCGCIKEEREIIQTERPIIVVAPSNNPFINPSAPKDVHLRSAYG